MKEERQLDEDDTEDDNHLIRRHTDTDTDTLTRMVVVLMLLMVMALLTVVVVVVGKLLVVAVA